MPFGLTNTPALLQQMIDPIFQDMKEYILHIDNILSYGSNIKDEHQAIIKKVV